MLPVFFAQERGLFKNENIEPVIVKMSGRLQAIALGTGEIDYAASVETILRSTMQGTAFKINVYTRESRERVKSLLLMFGDRMII